MRHKLLNIAASLLVLAIQDFSPQTARATSITVVSVDEDDLSATVHIFDNSPPPALPKVTIAATSPNASEVGPADGQFTVTRTGATISALTVDYAPSGTAINGTDYSTLSGSVTIAAGSATATITVTPLVDALTEGAEAVNLTLSANAAYNVGSPRSATVNIFDNSPAPALPMVTIAATSPNASEVGPADGQFTVTRTGATTSALTVRYAISGTAINGTDYSTLSGSVTIAAGSTTATITVTPLVDTLTEGAETVILTLSANAAYNAVGSPKGFEDLGPPDPASTVGGNTGATLGAQRLIAAQYAADLWADLISSKVPILVDAKFDAPNAEHPDATDPFNSLDCAINPPVIATAEPTTYHGNFVKSPKKNTWYPQALANSLAGIDLRNSSDIRAYFNSSVGEPGCLPDNSWYYGLDGNALTDQFDFVTVVLRELAHGLGFITTVNLSDGKKLGGLDDVFSLKLKDVSTDKLFSQMTNAERQNAISNTGNLHWIGANVVAAYGGEVPMYAPDPVNLDFSVSNWDISLSPDELMVPFYSGANHDVGLALQALEDIGWTLDPRPNGTVNVVPTDATALEGVGTATFTVRRTVPTSDPLTVSYIVSGKATNTTDYDTLSGIVEIPAGESSAAIAVTPVFDPLNKEKDESVIVTLQSDPLYTLGFPSSATVTIQNNAVKFGTGTPPPGEVGVPYNFVIPVSGGEEPYQNPVDISKPLPDGLTLSGLTIQGTPSSLAKTATFTVKVTDQQGVSVSKSYTITVLKAVNITTTSLKDATKNKLYTVFLKASGGKKAYTWSIASGTLPTSLHLDAATGRISGTPLPSDSGTHNLTFRVTDALGGTNEQPLTLTIN